MRGPGLAFANQVTRLFPSIPSAVNNRSKVTLVARVHRDRSQPYNSSSLARIGEMSTGYGWRAYLEDWDSDQFVIRVGGGWSGGYQLAQTVPWKTGTTKTVVIELDFTSSSGQWSILLSSGESFTGTFSGWVDPVEATGAGYMDANYGHQNTHGLFLLPGIHRSRSLTLLRNPWQLLQPEPADLAMSAYASGGGGGLAEISGASTATLGSITGASTGTVTGGGAVAAVTGAVTRAITRTTQPQEGTPLAAQWAPKFSHVWNLANGGLGTRASLGSNMRQSPNVVLDNLVQPQLYQGRPGVTAGGRGLRGLYQSNQQQACGLTGTNWIAYSGASHITMFAVVTIDDLSRGDESPIIRATDASDQPGIALGWFPASRTIRPLVNTNGATSGWRVGNDTVDSRIVAGRPWFFAFKYVSGQGIKVFSGPLGEPAKLLATYGDVSGTISGSNGPVYIGGSSFNGGQIPFPGTVHMAGWSSATPMSDAELSAFGQNPWQIFEPQQRVYAVSAAAPAEPTDITANSSATLGGVTQVSAATALVTGSSSATLGAIVHSSTAAVRVQGNSSSGLGAVTGASTGAASVRGDQSNTLGAVTGSSTGAVVAAGTITGSATSTLGATTGASTGTVTTPALTANSSAALGAITASSSGTVAVVGNSSRTLGATAGASTAGVVVIASSAGTVGAVTGSSTGTAGFSVRTGHSSAQLGGVSGSSTGAVRIGAAQSSTLAALTGSGAAQIRVRGTSASTLGAIGHASLGTTVPVGPSALLVQVPAHASPMSVGAHAAPMHVPAHASAMNVPEGPGDMTV